VRPDRRPAGVSYLGWIVKRLGCAFSGLFQFLAEPTNLRIHLPAAALAVALSAWLKIDRLEWCFVILAIGLVFTAEGLNSALESLADAVHPGHHPLVGHAKDVAAGAVLLSSFVAAAVGCVVFLPRLIALLG
jgi:diacylglycerol kinase